MWLPWRWQRYRTIPLEQAKAHVLCPWCGGIHSFACPRVQRMTFDTQDNERRVLGVEFWPQYSKQLWDDVVWPDESQ